MSRLGIVIMTIAAQLAACGIGCLLGHLILKLVHRCKKRREEKKVEHSTGMQETAGEMNYIASLFVHQFYEWAKGKNVEPHHIMAVVDWGPFTTVAKTVWTSEKQMALMLFNAKKYLDSEAERIGGFKIPKELES